MVARRQADVVQGGIRDEVGWRMAQDEDLGGKAAVPQLHCLVRCRHGQQSDLFLFQDRRDARCTMSIGVCFHDTDDLRPEGNARPDGIQVVSQCCEVDLCYCRPVVCCHRRFLQVEPFVSLSLLLYY
jgi:hypothetical protein